MFLFLFNTNNITEFYFVILFIYIFTSVVKPVTVITKKNIEISTYGVLYRINVVLKL